MLPHTYHVISVGCWKFRGDYSHICSKKKQGFKLFKWCGGGSALHCSFRTGREPATNHSKRLSPSKSEDMYCAVLWNSKYLTNAINTLPIHGTILVNTPPEIVIWVSLGNKQHIHLKNFSQCRLDFVWHSVLRVTSQDIIMIL